MIDCHTHLALEDFDPDREAVIARARRAGVEQILVVGEDAADSQRVLEVCARHADVLRPCVGLHPDRFAEDRDAPNEASIAAVVQLARARRGRLVAIGEVGLDYWYVKTDERRAAQRNCLEQMAALAAELDLPLNVHSRSAGRHTIDLLAGCGAHRVLMHAFDGKAGHAIRAVEQHGYLFSIPPSLVRSAQKQKLVRRLPLEALALESDSPVLGPRPDERNEPANLLHTVRCIAALKGISEDRVRDATSENGRRLFG
ncbi:MAG: TatD family hydrolase [Gammaproteobacteria bacterium]|nr:TatD family hydrolase [Gammaproteobacteria bacterium]NIR83573.1 TatD family hydrolase [Gammaproteobacteria bacterium]NIR91495.1 TatD family hydrolase [Gammaproteobacteria bacterium]NIU04735.1 TatD family hydrolase [Gammaproteobacteria bacterium]NIV51777.1 amidohydrolase family protein [Gammaproteobacteria bacterium]